MTTLLWVLLIGYFTAQMLVMIRLAVRDLRACCAPRPVSGVSDTPLPINTAFVLADRGWNGDE